MTQRRLTNLPMLPPGEAHLRQMIPGALTGRPCGADSRLVACLPAQLPAQTAWFGCAQGLAFAIDSIAGRPVRLGPADGIAAAEALDALEPVFRAVETGLGIELEPVELVVARATDALVARIESVAAGVTRHRLYLALMPDQPILPAAPVLAPELLGHVQVPVRIRIEGPRVSPHDGASLGPGDLVLLGPGPLVAQLLAPTRATLTGGFDPRRRAFIPSLDLRQEPHA